MIKDGFGDESVVDYDHFLREKRGLVEIQVTERSNDPGLWDDLVQEGLITAWQAARRHPEKPPAYIHAATRQRVSGVVVRQDWTGKPPKRDRGSREPLNLRDRDSFDDPLFVVEAASPEVLDAILLAYHHGEIWQALEGLSAKHREYVVLRFWGGWTSAELAPLLGVKINNVARVWNEQIRPVLAERLAHLIDA